MPTHGCVCIYTLKNILAVFFFLGGGGGGDLEWWEQRLQSKPVIKQSFEIAEREPQSHDCRKSKISIAS